MSAPRLRKQYGVSNELNTLQENVEEVIGPLLDLPFASSVFLEDVPLVAGNNRILHKLERNYRGFVVTRLQPTVPTTGASYTSVVSNRGDWAAFTPVVTMNAGVWTTGVVQLAQYRQFGQTVEIQLNVTGTISGAAGNRVLVSIPVPMATAASLGSVDTCYVATLSVSAGVASIGICAIDYINNRLTFFAGPTSPAWGLGSAQISLQAFYTAASINTFPQPLEVATTQPQTELILSSTGQATCDLVIF